MCTLREEREPSAYNKAWEKMFSRRESVSEVRCTLLTRRGTWGRAGGWGPGRGWAHGTHHLTAAAAHATCAHAATHPTAHAGTTHAASAHAASAHATSAHAASAHAAICTASILSVRVGGALTGAMLHAHGAAVGARGLQGSKKQEGGVSGSGGASSQHIAAAGVVEGGMHTLPQLEAPGQLAKGHRLQSLLHRAHACMAGHNHACITATQHP